jgi:hypothetical protein
MADDKKVNSAETDNKNAPTPLEGQFAPDNVRGVCKSIAYEITKVLSKKDPDFNLKVKKTVFFRKGDKYVLVVKFNTEIDVDFGEVFLNSFCETLNLVLDSVKVTGDKEMKIKFTDE